MPINITFSNTTDRFDRLPNFFHTSLTGFMSEEYIESILQLTLQAGIPANQTKLECIIEGLGNDSIQIFVNSSGKS